MNKKSAAGSGMRFLIWICACLMVLACASLGRAQALADAPVLISEAKSTRALVVDPGINRGTRLPASTQVAWPAGNDTRVTVFATNLVDLLADEGATAFRADVTTGQGRRYSLTVESITPLVSYPWIYAVTIRLNGDLENAGDVLLRLNWRGMASNRVRLSVGTIGGGPKDDEGSVPTPAPLSPPEPVSEERIARPFDPDNMRLLEQATFGPTYASELRLRRIGAQRWIEEQMTPRFDGPNPRYSSMPYPVVTLEPTNIPTGCNAACIRDNYSMYKLQNWLYQEAMYGEDQQLRRRVSWALHQIFVVSGRDTQQPSHLLPYIQILDRHAFGSFREILREMTLNPAMGNYLDTIRSTQANPNENYAREILQLFSIGLDMLKRDGTPRLDANGNRIPTYSQDTINGFTKVFTGWNLCNSAPPVCPSNTVAGRLNYIDPLRVNLADHDTGQKVLLAYPNHPPFVVPAGQTPAEDLRLAIDNIFLHPNVAPFISKLLIQHLVTSNPTPAYVDRVARVFEADSIGERGNLGSVVKAILLDPEARGNQKTDPDYGYLKEPVLFVTNLMRTFDARSATRTVLSDGVLNGITIGLDQDVWNPPSVFNYYPPDYQAPNTSILGPEYAIMTTGTTLKRPNFVNQMVFQAQGIPVNAGNGIPNGTSITMERLQPLAAADLTGGQLVDTVNSLMMHGSMSAAMRNSIMQAVQAVPSADSLKRARTAVYLVATSSQYQVQR